MRGVERNSGPEWITSGEPSENLSPGSHREHRSPWKPSATGIGSSTKSPVLAGQAREAANVVVRQRHHANWRGQYVVRLFERTRQRKGHAVAVGATARYLAEATFWVLKKGEPYREPVPRPPVGLKSTVSPRQAQARA
jgi:hypothetical protein